MEKTDEGENGLIQLTRLKLRRRNVIGATTSTPHPHTHKPKKNVVLLKKIQIFPIYMKIHV